MGGAISGQGIPFRASVIFRHYTDPYGISDREQYALPSRVPRALETARSLAVWPENPLQPRATAGFH